MRVCWNSGIATSKLFDEMNFRHKNNNITFICMVFLCMNLFVNMFPDDALAWGTLAHAVIDRAAIDSLPDDGPDFLKKYINITVQSASYPDIWRSASEPFSKIEEDPNHGWFREQFSFMKDVPRSRYEFILELFKKYKDISPSDRLAASRMNVRWTGTLPYAVLEEYGHLVADMRLIRTLRMQGKDASALEMNCAFLVAWMGHYIADGSQPLHVTIHHDGWVGPDPKGYTRDPNIHSRFESRYVEMIGLSEADILPRVGPIDHLDGDVFDQVLSYLDHSHQYVETIYILDKHGSFDSPSDTRARNLVYERTAAASEMLRDLIYRAWRESGVSPPVLPNPNDPLNSSYDSETGSVPAPLSTSIKH